MEEENKPKISKWKFRIILFVTFFLRSFFPLFLLCLVCLIVGIFIKEFLIIGTVLLAVDFIVSLYFTIRTSMLKGSHEMFNKIVQAARGEDPYGDLDKITGEWENEDYYSEKANELRGEAGSLKTVSEIFELYKKEICNLAFSGEKYTVYIKKEKYFFDDQMHYVISFDRMREVNDDLEQHLYMDILFSPDRFERKIEETFEGLGGGETAEFFNQVREYLESNGLMELEIEDINVGASY